jgi:hypothetical protein
MSLSSDVRSEHVEITFQLVYDATPDTAWLEEPGNEDRKAAWTRNEWHFVGIIVIVVFVEQDTRFEVRSPGLWNVESDADEAYLMGLGHQELKEMPLKAHGINVKGVAPVLDRHV